MTTQAARLDKLDTKKGEILKMRETGATWKEVAKALNCSRSTLHNWRVADDEFAKACEVAGEIGLETIEDALFVAAAKVADDPRYTTAAIFFLKNRRPERWRDVKAYQHSGRMEFAHLSTEELERMAHAAGHDEDDGQS